MGFGDELLATGMARGASGRGKRIAFGDGKRIIFSPWSEQIFRNNPNIARPGDEGSDDIEWIAHYKGSRLYNRLSPDGRKWIWNLEFRPVAGELFFSDDELRFSESIGSGFIVIEPNVPWFKTVFKNKDWGAARYQALACELSTAGHRVIQFVHESTRVRLESAASLYTPTFRHALAVLSRAAIYIGPEGGLHHGAAAVGISAVVLFGGFIPPSVTGYPTHTNLTGGATACGRLQSCRHCKDAMAAIGVDRVLGEATQYLPAIAA